MLSAKHLAQKLTFKIPQSYFCSITGQIMIEPVFTADGQAYEREAIEEWLKTHDTSPKTGVKMPHKNLTPNWDKKGDITEFLEEHPELYDGDELYSPKSWTGQLVAALKANQISAVQELLSKDKRLCVVKLEGNYTAFHLACEFGSPELITILLEKVQQINQLGRIKERPAGFKPVYLNVLFQQALERQDQAKFTLLLELGADLEQPEIATKNTLLHRLAIQGLLEPIKWLLARGAELERLNAEGNTALLLSVLHNHTELATFLLTMKANQQVKNAKQQTPVSIAILNQNRTIISLLIGDKQAALPPLHLSLELDDNELLQALLAQKIGSITAVDSQQRPVFYVAVQKGNLKAARLLLANGANPCGAGLDQLTPLHVAAERGDLEMLNLLLSIKAVVDVIDSPNILGNTALHLAAQAGQDNVIPLLLKAGAWHKTKNQQGQTPIELARQQNKTPTANLIERTAHALKQAKLAEIDKLRQLAREQAALIEELGKALSGEQQERIKAQQQLEQALRAVRQEHEPILTRFRQKQDKLRQEQEMESQVNPAHLQAFLNQVAAGQQDEAEAMLKQNPVLALVPGTVTDHAKRTFIDITGFQYAVWALDWHMWKMIKKYLPIEAARAQSEGFGSGSWVKEHGEYVTWKRLVDNYQTYIDSFDKWDWHQRNDHWIQQIGGAQLLLPMHVFQEYCEPSRPFDPVPNFKGEIVLVRRLPDWLTPEKCGRCFSIFRAVGAWAGGADARRSETARRDRVALVQLADTRTQQRGELVAELRSGKKLLHP